MAHRTWAGVAVLVVLVAAALATTTEVWAAPTASKAAATGKACPPFHGRKWQLPYGGKSGTRYQWSITGTAFTCKTAKPWVVKLTNDLIHVSGLLHKGPKGYKCLGTADKEGYAATGVCFKGSIATYKEGFSWSGSTKPKRHVASSIAGKWSGKYSGAFSGTFKLHWTRSGSTLSGSITLSNPSGTYSIKGSVHGSKIAFGALAAGATYTGAWSGKSMSGHYNTPKGGGPWSAHKTS